MKKRELHRIGTSLAQSLPGFVARGDLLFVSPIRHALRGVCFAGSIDKRGFYAQILLQPLFVPNDTVVFNAGWRLGAPADLWDADAPGMVGRLLEGLRRDALPFLEQASTIEGLTTAIHGLSKSGDVRVREMLGYAYACVGDVARCRRELSEITGDFALKPDWVLEMKQRAQWLMEHVATNHALVKSQLLEWEAETVNYLGLSEDWVDEPKT